MTVALAKGNQGLVWRTFPQEKKKLNFSLKEILVLNSKEVLVKKDILSESL